MSLASLVEVELDVSPDVGGSDEIELLAIARPVPFAPSRRESVRRTGGHHGSTPSSCGSQRSGAGPYLWSGPDSCRPRALNEESVRKHCAEARERSLVTCPLDQPEPAGQDHSVAGSLARSAASSSGNVVLSSALFLWCRINLDHPCFAVHLQGVPVVIHAVRGVLPVLPHQEGLGSVAFPLP